MSDLEASLRRIGNAAAPVSTAAVGKLRAISGRSGRLFGNADGLVDAFAEVFANIAQSQPSAKPEPKQREADAIPVRVESRESRQESVVPERQVKPTDNNSQRDRQASADDPSTTTRSADDSSRDAAKHNEDAPQIVTEESGPQQAPAELAAPVVKETVTNDQTAESEVEVATPLHHDSEAENDRQGKSRSRENAVQPARQPTIENAAESAPSDDTTKQTSAATFGNSGDEAKQQSEDSSSNRWADPLSEDSKGSRAEHLHDRKTGLADRRDTDVSQKNAASPTAQVSDQALQAKTSINASKPATGAVQAASAAPSAEVTQAAAVASNAATSSSSAQASSTTQSGNVRGRSFSHAIDTVNRTEARSEAKPRETQQSTSETVSRAKLIQRVSKAFQHLGNEGGIIRMRLAPAELGSVRVEMRVQHRKVEARVVAETEAASAALRQYLPDLRQRLEAQGMQIERIEIESETSEDASQGQFGGYDRGDQSDRQPQRRLSRWSAERSDDNSVSQSVSRVDVGHPLGASVPITGGVDARF